MKREINYPKMVQAKISDYQRIAFHKKLEKQGLTVSQKIRKWIEQFINNKIN